LINNKHISAIERALKVVKKLLLEGGWSGTNWKFLYGNCFWENLYTGVFSQNMKMRLAIIKYNMNCIITRSDRCTYSTCHSSLQGQTDALIALVIHTNLYYEHCRCNL